MVDTDDTRRTTNDGRRTTPWVWHKLPTGELKDTEMSTIFSTTTITNSNTKKFRICQFISLRFEKKETATFLLKKPFRFSH